MHRSCPTNNLAIKQAQESKMSTRKEGRQFFLYNRKQTRGEENVGRLQDV